MTTEEQLSISVSRWAPSIKATKSFSFEKSLYSFNNRFHKPSSMRYPYSFRSALSCHWFFHLKNKWPSLPS